MHLLVKKRVRNLERVGTEAVQQPRPVGVCLRAPPPRMYVPATTVWLDLPSSRCSKRPASFRHAVEPVYWDVAVKQQSETAQLTELEKEATQGPFSHTNVIEVLGYCEKHKEIVMECGWHGSFDKLLLATPPPPVGTVLRILLHAARGMLFFHHLREQYRLDLKEQNVVLGCEGHFTLKRCTRDPLDEGHKLVGKLADFGTLTSNPLDSRAGTSTHQDAVAQQGIAGAPLSYDDRHNFGVMMRNALEHVTGEVPPNAVELASRCKTFRSGFVPLLSSSVRSCELSSTRLEVSKR
jgi:hypothetical protein